MDGGHWRRAHAGPWLRSQPCFLLGALRRAPYLSQAPQAERSRDEFRFPMANHLTWGTVASLTPCCVTLGKSELLRP